MTKYPVPKQMRDWISVVREAYLGSRRSYLVKRKSSQKLGIVFLMLAIFFGCSKKSPLPKDMASMAQIYDEHTQEVRIKRMDLKDARERISRPLKNHGVDLDGYTRDAHNEIQGIFPELPNPTLVMYLFPHLSENGAPVPGYSTTFTMYDKTQYALPGEVGGN